MRLLKWLGLGAVVWIIYWASAAWGLRNGFETWFQEQQRQGWQVAYGPMQTSGFPLRHTTRLDHPLLADPGTGAAWSADWVTFDSPAIWPGSQRIGFPETAQRLSIFDQTRILTAQNMQVDLQLAPGLALELEWLGLESEAWQVSDSSGLLWQAQDLTLEMRQKIQPETYQLQASAMNFAPSALMETRLRAFHRLNGDLPPQFESLRLLAEVEFDTPWDRRAIELRRPQLRQIELELAEAQWGEMLFRAAGHLQVDETGQITGDLTLQAKNWRAILDMAERMSLLPPSTRATVERVLALFSTEGNGGEKIDSTLRFEQGKVWIGPLPIGTAPRLILR